MVMDTFKFKKKNYFYEYFILFTSVYIECTINSKYKNLLEVDWNLVG